MDEAFDLPIASIARIIRNALPKHYQVGKDARLAMAKATSVWILYASTVANNISSSRKRKTISGDDVLSALVEMDFEDFVSPLQEMRSELSTSRKKISKAKSGAAVDAEDEANAQTDVKVDTVEEEDEEDDGDIRSEPDAANDELPLEPEDGISQEKFHSHDSSEGEGEPSEREDDPVEEDN